MSAETVKSEFVTREVFDAYIQSINSRVTANQELDDMRNERRLLSIKICLTLMVLLICSLNMSRE